VGGGVPADRRSEKTQRHLVQTHDDDQMGSTPGGAGLVLSTKPTTPQEANRGADGRVRVSDRD